MSMTVVFCNNILPICIDINIKSQKHQQQQHEITLMEFEGREREHRLNTEQLEVDLKLKDSIILNLNDENKRIKDRLEEMEEEIHSLEEELKKSEKLEELEELVIVVKQKNDRIEEMEEALRQSVRIAADMEHQKAEDELQHQKTLEKVQKLETRILSYQNAQSLRCMTCRPMRKKFDEIEQRLNHLLKERRSHLQELFDMKNEALTSAISEKDAHLALLEVGGVRSAKAAQDQQNLHQEKKRLIETIKKQNEERVQLLQEYASVEFGLDDQTPPNSPKILRQQEPQHK